MTAPFSVVARMPKSTNIIYLLSFSFEISSSSLFFFQEKQMHEAVINQISISESPLASLIMASVFAVTVKIASSNFCSKHVNI